MKKLIRGILDFRAHRLEEYRAKFAHLALGQRPDSLMIACSDSRVAPNAFASTDPGDLFVVRNVGNMVPVNAHLPGETSGAASEGAALQFAIEFLGVRNIIICGHSECGAMKAVLERQVKGALESWLENADTALKRFEKDQSFAKELLPHNRLSQLNVLAQVDRMMGFPFVKEQVNEGKLIIHPWWFELQGADVYGYDEKSHSFKIIEGEFANQVLSQVKD